MTTAEWKELEKLTTSPDSSQHRSPRVRVLLDLTETEDDHPDKYEGPCFCKTCITYADA